MHRNKRNSFKTGCWVAGAAILLCTASCRKYARPDAISQAAYIRVFNGTNSPAAGDPDTLNLVNADPWITFLLDPVMDSSGNPVDAVMLGDFIGPMPDYYLPQQVRPGQKATGAFTNSANEDYPGVQTVQTAPSLNGLDLSRWAQAPPGRHRILFVFRQISDQPFPSLSLSYRRPVIIDTTLDLEAGVIYTLEALNAHPDDSHVIRMHIRKETLATTPFSPDKIYLNFYNFTTDTSILPAVFDAYYCKYYDSSGVAGFASHVLTSETYLATVPQSPVGGPLPAAPYYTMPATPRDSFAFPDGNYRPLQKRPTVIIRLYRPGMNAAAGDRPFLTFTSGDLYFAGSGPGLPFNGHAEGWELGPMEQTITIDNQSNSFPMINSLELRIAPRGRIVWSLITVEHFVKTP